MLIKKIVLIYLNIFKWLQYNMLQRTLSATFSKFLTELLSISIEKKTIKFENVKCL